MSGSVAEVPGLKIPYHCDGTLLWGSTTTGGAAATLSSGWSAFGTNIAAELNNMDNVGHVFGSFNPGLGYALTMKFPQPVHLKGHRILASESRAAGYTLSYSTNTTDGKDGTWTSTPAAHSLSAASVAISRFVTAVNIPDVVGVRLHCWGAHGTSSSAVTIRDFQLYGAWQPSGLGPWDAVLDQPALGPLLDFGDVLLGTLAFRAFRVKNGGASAANSVTISTVHGSADIKTGLEFSLNGGPYASSVSIPSIPAGGVSPVIKVKRAVGSAEATLALTQGVIHITATSWGGATEPNTGMFTYEYVVPNTNPAKRWVWDGVQWVHVPDYVWNGTAWVVVT